MYTEGPHERAPARDSARNDRAHTSTQRSEGTTLYLTKRAGRNREVLPAGSLRQGADSPS